MDPLSDVIRAVRLSGAHFYRVEAAAPWSVSSIAARDLVPRVIPDAEHLIAYHILLTGTCWAGLTGDDQVQMHPGDVVVFPQGDAHVMSSHQFRTVGNAGGTLVASRRFAETVYLGPEDGRDTTFVCGYLGCDARPFNPLVASLPRRMLAPGVAAGWLSALSSQVVRESRGSRLGNDTMLMRMAELLFIEVVRQHVERERDAQTGWLAALVDPVAGAALACLHERPAHPWTLPELARACAASRTVLVERFSRAIGEPPMLYLKRWRLQLAADMLARSASKVAVIAAEVGYESEAAFSRAFKQETGVSPGAWRRQRAG